MKIRFLVFIFSFSIFFNCTSQNQTVTKDIDSDTLISSVIEDDSVTSNELKELIDRRNENYLLIDVRTEREYKSGHIPTAIHIPHTEIKENLDRLPADKLIIVYCKVGGRASFAAKLLKNRGYEKVINFGGIKDYRYNIKIIKK